MKNSSKNVKTKKNMPVIEPINMDMLAIMSDDELDNIESRLINECEKVASLNGDTRRWEEELCYIQRERDIRDSRNKAHKAWYSQFRQEFEYVDDFENAN